MFQIFQLPSGDLTRAYGKLRLTLAFPIWYVWQLPLSQGAAQLCDFSL